ncbi:hypothetical protein ACFQHV_13460 [Promicromonospora thailandica]|uniref:Uncharacterized protein n=1 Tax=Promicromonospora thailandica TaxID=765201 RepID=A0A9X2G705_9MICO|nr:hypothetical protein [Promicromonospora thailandica]MCP2266903.1 hypothetical protein [Promicromonospora thailandica]BFF16571.1 hypothetical protein GCM10025730_00920 [Promicromonospora thailandica]
MNQHRPTGSPVPGPGSQDGVPRDELAERVAAALRSREPDPAAVDAAAQRIAARVAAAADDRGAVVTPFVRRAGRVAVTGVVTSTIVVAGATAAAAANPYTGFAVAVEHVVQSVGIEWSAMPAGLTREQYDAFWTAGYTAEDQTELAELWSLDDIATKARAGQMILDGQAVPVAPGSADGSAGLPADPAQAARTAFSDAGYEFDDAVELAELWHVSADEAKARAGRMLIEGEQPPLP